MKKQNKNIVNKLRLLSEGLPSPEDMRANFQKTTDAMTNIVKTELDTDDEETKEIVGGILKSGVSENDASVDVEIGADKYEEYRALMAQLAAEEGGVQSVSEMGEEPTSEPTNNPVKLKADVVKLMAKLDMSSIAPYLAKIDNPTERASMAIEFLRLIGVDKTKLGMVIAKIKELAMNPETNVKTEAKMSKSKLIETVTGRKIIKTIKVKDIK